MAVKKKKKAASVKPSEDHKDDIEAPAASEGPNSKRSADLKVKAGEERPLKKRKQAKEQEEEKILTKKEEKRKTKEAEEVPPGEEKKKEKGKKKAAKAEGQGVQSEEAAATGEEAGDTKESSKRGRNKKTLKQISRKALAEAAKNKEQEAGGGISEEDRIALSRKIQSLVRTMREQGKPELEIEKAKRELKKEIGPLKQPNSRRSIKRQAWSEWVETQDAQTKRQKKATREHELVVIPVVWRGRHDKLDIIKAAEDVKACVAQQGIDTWIDARRHYTPGQKFAHWEHRGVLLRVEIGPDDLAAGMCRVCRAMTPGDYKSVERKRVRLPPAGARQLLLILKEWGMSQIEVERRPGDSDEEEDTSIPLPKASDKKPEDAGNKVAEILDEDLTGNWRPSIPEKQRPQPKSKSKKKQAS